MRSSISKRKEKFSKQKKKLSEKKYFFIYIIYISYINQLSIFYINIKNNCTEVFFVSNYKKKEEKMNKFFLKEKKNTFKILDFLKIENKRKQRKKN